MLVQLVLLSFLSANVFGVTLRGDGDCVSGEADIVITVPYEDYRGQVREKWRPSVSRRSYVPLAY